MSDAIGPRDGRHAPVPVLTPGRASIEARCPLHPQAILSADPPMDGDRFGTLSCGACGRVLGHVAAPLRTFSARPVEAPIVAARSSPPTPLSGPEWRTPGCSLACRRGIHEPRSHEAYGRYQARAEMEAQQARPSGVVRTGPLVVDFETQQARLHGQDLRASGVEFGILAALAAQIGCLVAYGALVRDVWGLDTRIPYHTKSGVDSYEMHTLRIHLSRLRKKLGSSADLIETVKERGYILRADPPL